MRASLTLSQMSCEVKTRSLYLLGIVTLSHLDLDISFLTILILHSIASVSKR